MFQELKANVILAANRFNPSIVTQVWLIKKGIIAEDDFLIRECIFTGEIVQAATKRFNLAVVEPHTQFYPRVAENEWASVTYKTLMSFVTSLPETPYSAIGLNFVGQLVPPDKTVQDLERCLFVAPTLPLAREFDGPDCHFGGYYSKDFEGSRLKLEVKPISYQTENGTETRLQLSFNFHRDLESTTAIDSIDEHLKLFPVAHKYAHDIIKKVLAC